MSCFCSTFPCHWTAFFSLLPPISACFPWQVVFVFERLGFAMYRCAQLLQKKTNKTRTHELKTMLLMHNNHNYQRSHTHRHSLTHICRLRKGKERKCSNAAAAAAWEKKLDGRKFRVRWKESSSLFHLQCNSRTRWHHAAMVVACGSKIEMRFGIFRYINFILCWCGLFVSVAQFYDVPETRTSEPCDRLIGLIRLVIFPTNRLQYNLSNHRVPPVAAGISRRT